MKEDMNEFINNEIKKLEQWIEIEQEAKERYERALENYESLDSEDFRDQIKKHESLIKSANNEIEKFGEQILKLKDHIKEEDNNANNL